jgi:hypothetical protein
VRRGGFLSTDEEDDAEVRRLLGVPAEPAAAAPPLPHRPAETTETTETTEAEAEAEAPQVVGLLASSLQSDPSCSVCVLRVA